MKMPKSKSFKTDKLIGQAWCHGLGLHGNSYLWNRLTNVY